MLRQFAYAKRSWALLLPILAQGEEGFNLFSPTLTRGEEVFLISFSPTLARGKEVFDLFLAYARSRKGGLLSLSRLRSLEAMRSFDLFLVG